MAVDLAKAATTRDQRLQDLSNLEIKLFSSEVQLFWEQNGTQQEKEDFVTNRTDVVLARAKLENEILEKIASRLLELDESLQAGINNLQQELNSLESTIAILNVINPSDWNLVQSITFGLKFKPSIKGYE